MAAELGLDETAVKSDAFVKFFAGNNAALPGSFETELIILELIYCPCAACSRACDCRPAMLGNSLRP